MAATASTRYTDHIKRTFALAPQHGNGDETSAAHPKTVLWFYPYKPNVMAYTLTIGNLHVISTANIHTETLTCNQARDLCTPSFVFSVQGQVGFRAALHHLSECSSRPCRKLMRHIHGSMKEKLGWLFNEQCLLGCVHVQPMLYGEKRISLTQKDFSATAHHLSICPKDSCAQLRRALLLKIRDDLRPTPN